MVIWRLRAGSDRRFRSGHPWVYSNELQDSPKGVEPGAPVELRDPAGGFLARGYGNPASLIAFRALSRDPTVDPHSAGFLADSIRSAESLRQQVGLGPFSHRVCFGEADFIPGLVIDRYLIDEGQVFVVQAHTAGADRRIPQVLEALEASV